jgi:hypothetical protein
MRQRKKSLAITVLLTGSSVVLSCSTVNPSSGGNPGAGGQGGIGGTAGNPLLLCEESTGSCESGEVEPIVEDPSCTIGKPPVQSNMCEGTESLENPVSCTPTGKTMSYQLTLLEIVEDCDLGYDLDGCNGNSCLLGDLAPAEGADGVDNALAGLASFLEPLGGNLGGVSQAFYDAICDGRLDVRLIVDANPEEGCASVTTYVDDNFSGSVLLNHSEAGCLSGGLGSVLLTLGGGITRELGNVVLRMTMTDDGLSDGIVGATLDQATAGAIADEFLGVPAAGLVARLLDIDEELDRDPDKPCTALSATLKLGGVPSP